MSSWKWFPGNSKNNKWTLLHKKRWSCLDSYKPWKCRRIETDGGSLSGVSSISQPVSEGTVHGSGGSQSRWCWWSSWWWWWSSWSRWCWWYERGGVDRLGLMLYLSLLINITKAWSHQLSSTACTRWSRCWSRLWGSLRSSTAFFASSNQNQPPVVRISRFLMWSKIWSEDLFKMILLRRQVRGGDSNATRSTGSHSQAGEVKS